jgi:hypothetical protein
MKIEILYVADCPHFAPALDLVERALREEGVSAEIETRKITDLAGAAAVRFPGSPTIRMNGRDVVERESPDEAAIVGCRLYPEAGGIPPLESVRRAVRAGKRREGL